MQEMWVQSLSWEDPLEKGMATHSYILAWEIAWTEEPSAIDFYNSKTQRRGWLQGKSDPEAQMSEGDLFSSLQFSEVLRQY